MIGGLTILHTADSHLGAGLVGRPRSDRSRRGDDIVAAYRRVLASAGRGVDLLIHSGDLYDLPEPGCGVITAAATPLLELAASGVPIVIVPGNHERSAIPTSPLLAHPLIHIVDRPGTVALTLQGLRVAVAGFPCLRRQSAARFADAVEATEWRRQRADVNILAVHQTFEGATCGPGNYRFRSGEDVVERSGIPDGFDYVAAGHVHRHQVLRAANERGTPIVYAGSPDRISFAEIDEPKGYVLVSGDGGRLKHRFLEHAVRPMRILSMDVSGLVRDQIVEQALAVVEALPADAVAQLRLTGKAERRAMSGLNLAGLADQRRPDVRLTLSMRAVAYVSPSGTSIAGPGEERSIFAGFPGSGDRLSRLPVGNVGLLPKAFGVYAMFDATRRLLYVGKAGNLRGRVRSHLRPSNRPGFFEGWTRAIASVEYLRLYSELEALLVEAELIRRHQPPFNSRMRLWPRYVYLCENGLPFGQLAVVREPASRQRCYGPFRSRAMAEELRQAAAELFGTALCPEAEKDSRSLQALHVPGLWHSEDAGPAGRCPQLPQIQSPGSPRPVRALPGKGLTSGPAVALCGRYYDGICGGPCGGKEAPGPYGLRLRARDEFLRGEVDTTSRRWEEAVGAALAGADDRPGLGSMRRRVSVLRHAFDHAATLAEAGRLRGALLVLPGPIGARRVAVVTDRGLRVATLRPEAEDARRILRGYRTWWKRQGHMAEQCLPKSIVDVLCTAVQTLRNDPASYLMLTHERLASLDVEALITAAFREGDSC